ncbi:hypothetical protein HMPREF9151_02490 [Hoylesella saccharolytica F0055]|uniref:Uncharacterized protein n=1 Tax=Hoylesella saccharolytica F0055 TaxID=1127699 RepID=L1MY76_9BACT|nr:TerB family tellurite resistance protein [Hoylesella saccharolytica]EKX96243.1 hypothetical protein HMPREF9151_02490 [Hoylesella saccharolytica F0055]
MNEKMKSEFIELYKMVLADGDVAPEEMEVLYRIGTKEYNVSLEEINVAIRDADTTFFIPETLDGKVRLLYHLAEIAWADGKIEESEKTLLKRYTDLFGFIEENQDALVDYMLEQVKEKVDLQSIINQLK